MGFNNSDTSGNGPGTSGGGSATSAAGSGFASGDAQQLDGKAEIAGRQAYTLLEQGRKAEAFFLLVPFEQTQAGGPALQFNLALCYAGADKKEKALERLERALEGMKKFQILPPSGRQEIYMSLRKKEIEDTVYSRPMQNDYPSCCPSEAREDIIMTLMDMYLKCGLPEKANALSASLAGDQFSSMRH
jgi:tetratricopeptide (TPR) repeat protein